MKILINKTDKNILPITKIYDLGSVTTTINDLLNESTIVLEKNITPILSIDGSNYLINNFNSTNIKEDFEAIITESDLISLGDSSGGDFIPLTGTTEGNPVTGDIKISDDYEIRSVSDNADRGFLSFSQSEEKVVIGVSKTSENKNSNVTFTTNLLSISQSDINSNTSISLEPNNVIISSSNSLSKGISGLQDFTPNITDLDYVQKKYVDEKVADSRPYKVYTALLTQSGTNAPVATVLENTLGGDIVWSYIGTGIYTGVLINTFTEEKTIGFSGNGRFSIGEPTTSIQFYRIDIDSVGIEISEGTDNLLSGFPIEIRVYN